VTRGRASWERGLLALEGKRDAGFLAALCDLTGADHVLVWAPSAGGAHGLALSTPVSDPVGATVLRPETDPLWFRLAGTAALHQRAALADVPVAADLPVAE